MNWGNKIIIVFAVFVVLMVTLVYKSYQTKFDLVSSKYYEDELAYQDIIEASKNTADLTEELSIIQNNDNFSLSLPANFSTEKISGKVWFYCAYNDGKDLKFPLLVDSNGTINYDKTRLSSGRYTMKVECNLEGKMYYIEKDIQI